jgi:hypothetical protein
VGGGDPLVAVPVDDPVPVAVPEVELGVLVLEDDGDEVGGVVPV